MQKIVKWRNFIGGKIYRWLLRPIFFRIDPERIHDAMSALLRISGKFSLTRKITYGCWGFAHPALTQNVWGIQFDNPVGLAGGFDKNGELADIMPSLGFGFAEIGSVTGEPCAGNPKPRLWRLRKSRSLVVYYGLKNSGCKIISERLKNKKFLLPIGINIAKTNCRETVNEAAGVADYFKAYEAFRDIGNFYIINISCPNTYGGEPFQTGPALDALLAKIFSVPKTKPALLKLGADLSKQTVDELLAVAQKYPVDGFICTNLTKKRDSKNILDKDVPPLGSLSGKIVAPLSDDLIRYVYKKTGGQSIIIGTGGIFSAEDAYRKIKAGASLVELITGMIFEGPQLISDINIGLVKLLEQDGYQNISEAVGKDNNP